MSDILLKNQKSNIEKISIPNILHNLYYNLYVLPTSLEIKQYNKKHNTDYQLEKLKEIISNIESDIPLFDISTKNIYLIPANQVYYYVTTKYYRLPNNKIYILLKNAHENTKIAKLKNILNKNINFLENYDLNILYNTYLRVIYENSNQIGKNITYCRKLTYLPYMSMSPYYTRSEIINMSLNMKLIKPDMTYYDNEKLDNLCLNLTSSDITGEVLLKHQIYIEKNFAQHIIYYYTFYGSQYYNNYLRQDTIYDQYVDNNIKQLFSLIKKSPAINTTNDQYVYRFVSSDDYLQNVQIKGIYKEESFISTSRNPFYEPKNHVFGYILLKIKIPKNKEGIGLCLETYSLFPNEQEILLAPGKLKLISIDDDFTYYHTNIIAQKNIKKIYEFEYIESLDEIKMKKRYDSSENIFEMSTNFSLISTDPYEKVIEFYRSIPIINDMHYFKWDKYMFQVFYLDKVAAYYKYYFLLKEDKTENKIEDIIFLVLQDKNTQEINLLIEISNVISVNYIHKYTGANSIKDDELIHILSYLSSLFEISTCIIHPNYKKYTNNISSNLTIPKIDIDEYNDEHELMKFSADITTYNSDVWNYLKNKEKVRFKNIDGIINKMNISTSDRFKRLSPETILKIQDTDILYKLWKKNKFTNIYDFLLYIHDNYFYLVPLLITKLSNIIKENLFLYGYYVYINNNVSTYTNDESMKEIENTLRNKSDNVVSDRKIKR